MKPQPPANPPTPPAPAPPNPPPTPTPTPNDPPSQPTQNMIPKDRFDEVNRQARDAASRAEAAEARLREIEEAEKTEAQKEKDRADREKARADAAEAQYQQTIRDNAVRAAATQAGAISPDAVVALVNSRKVEIDPDKPETITKALDAMRGTKEAPGPDAALFGEVNAPPTPTQPFGMPTTPPPGTPTPNGDPVDPKLAMGQGLLAAMGRAGAQK